MTFIKELNNYIKTLPFGWEVVEDEVGGYLLHLENKENFASIEIEYHQEMIVRNGEIKPYNWGTVGYNSSGLIPVPVMVEMVYEINEIIRKHT